MTVGRFLLVKFVSFYSNWPVLVYLAGRAAFIARGFTERAAGRLLAGLGRDGEDCERGANG
ncbi:hypothetical protein [Azoarcus sp. DN11]|uniref:hypothetical protein n=1 Tax=Azoarcus sp. DN11 TaxID=356837 RepID=UPI000EB48B97|nr:hypothetical protein [Azoarcus sp. DN11]AYH46099.1 hypothetical protein CDA09_22435 [Azoarcus sp. DN11]